MGEQNRGRQLVRNCKQVILQKYNYYKEDVQELVVLFDEQYALDTDSSIRIADVVIRAQMCH